MTTTLSNLERLRKEVFNGANFEWKISPRLGEELPYIETEQSWYFNKKGTDVIYVQPKSLGNSLTACFGCGENILAIHQIVNIWDKEMTCAVVDTRTREVRYCPNCEEEPKHYAVEIER